jgi:hypothetical protein
LVSNNRDNLTPFHALAPFHLEVAHVPRGGINGCVVGQAVGDDHDRALIADLLGQVDHALGDGVDWVTGCGCGVGLTRSVKLEPVLASVIQFAEWHALPVPVVEAFGCITQGGVLDAKAGVYIQRPGDTLDIRAVVVGI